MRDRLIELLDIIIQPGEKTLGDIADFLLANGVVCPPCKVGDKVYVITTKIPCHSCKNCSDFCHKYCGIKDRGKQVVKKAKVYSIELGEINKIHTTIEKTKRTSEYNYTRWFDDFGKTVFLTREEAEKALKGGEDNA